jgi:hypothetical protein
LYLIDHNGTIRKKWVGSPGIKVLDEEIDKLVKEADTPAALFRKVLEVNLILLGSRPSSTRPWRLQHHFLRGTVWLKRRATSRKAQVCRIGAYLEVVPRATSGAPPSSVNACRRSPSCSASSPVTRN